MDISVIVPVYYGKKYIKQMVEQIEHCARKLSREHSVELLFVNDAPLDPIDEQIFSEVIEVVVFNMDRNQGIQGARITGLESCRGEYVLFLDQDDLVKPEYLRSQIDCIGKADAVVCRAIHEGKIYYGEQNLFEKEVTKESMLSKGCGIVSPGQVLLRKSAISEVWKKNLLEHNGLDDWLLWLCMFGEGKKFALNQETLYEHVVNGKNAYCNTERILLSYEDVYKVLANSNIYSASELEILSQTVKKIRSRHFAIMDKFKKQFLLLNTWMKQESNGIKIEEELVRRGYAKIAIYGWGFIGQQLYGRLVNAGIEIAYAIDRDAPYINASLPIYTMADKLPDADVVVVTLVDGEEAVIAELQKKLQAEAISIRSLLRY